VKENPQNIIIETPEHVELHFRLAGIGTRFLAYLIDRAIQVGVLLGLVTIVILSIFLLGKFVPLVDLWGRVRDEVTQWVIAAAILVYGIMTIGYFILFEYLWSGSTPGKSSMNIRVIRKDGRPITIMDSAVRNILRFVDILGEIYPLGLVVMFIDSRNRRLGDLTAGTLVVYDSEIGRPPVMESPDRVPMSGAEDHKLIAGMTPGDYELVVKFLARRGGMEPKYRKELAKDISARVFKGSIHSRDRDEDPEKAIETAAALYRERTTIL